MILKDILNGVSGTLLQGDLQQEINSITIDSRKTESNVLFVAIKGMKVDGHSFIGGAYEKGCRAVIVEEDVENLPQDMTVYKVSESREALTVIAGNFYEHPSKKLNMIGVTGTNGKTSTTYFMESILNTIGHKTGVIGTVETRIGGKKRDIKFATSTTPDTLDLNAILKLMADENVEDLVMEVSSHGLALKKVDGIDFNIGIFTNLTQDHLDFHKTMENYCLAKAKLFKMCKTGIINVDDKWSQKIIDEATCDIITYSIDEPSDLQAKNIHYLMDRVVFTVNINGADVDFNLKLLKQGYYNICLNQVELYHYESKSRGDDTVDTKSAKYRRFVQEHDYIKDKWGYMLYSDRFYNPNLSLKKAFVLDKE